MALISGTIDERVEPDVQLHTPLPVQAAGARALNQPMALLLHVPDLHLGLRLSLAATRRSSSLARDSLVGERLADRQVSRRPVDSPLVLAVAAIQIRSPAGQS